MGMSWSSGWFCQYSSEDHHTHTRQSRFSLSRGHLQVHTNLSGLDTSQGGAGSSCALWCWIPPVDEPTQAEGQDWDKGQLSSGLTKDEKKLLSSSQSEDRDETAAFPVDNVMDGVTEAGLPLLPLLMDVSPIGGLLGHRQVEHRQTDTVRKTDQTDSSSLLQSGVLTVIRISGFTLGISAAIRCRSS